MTHFFLTFVHTFKVIVTLYDTNKEGQTLTVFALICWIRIG